MWSILLFALAGTALSQPLHGQRLVSRSPPKSLGRSKSTGALNTPGLKFSGSPRATEKLKSSPEFSKSVTGSRSPSASPRAAGSPKSPPWSPRTQMSFSSFNTQESYSSLDSSRIDLGHARSNSGGAQSSPSKDAKIGTSRPDSPSITRGRPLNPSGRQFVAASALDSRSSVKSSRSAPRQRDNTALASGTIFGPGSIVTNNQPGNPRSAMRSARIGTVHVSAAHGAEASASSFGGTSVTGSGRKSIGVHVINGPDAHTCVDCEFPGGAKTRAFVGPGSIANFSYENPTPDQGRMKASVGQWGSGTTSIVALSKRGVVVKLSRRNDKLGNGNRMTRLR